MIFWLFGRSGSGKTTIAELAKRALGAGRSLMKVIDGDDFRQTVSKDLGFTPEDRGINIARACWVSKMFHDEGFTVISCFETPLRKHREIVDDILGGSVKFVHIHASFEECKRRDPKKLYAKKLIKSDIFELAIGFGFSIQTQSLGILTSVIELINIVEGSWNQEIKGY